MGFFDKIFGKKEIEEVEEVDIDFNNLNVWLEKEKDIALKNVNSFIKYKYNDIDYVFRKLKENLTKLQTAGTDKNVYISKKESQIISSNRENYIKQLDLFLEKSRAKELSYKTTLEYADLLQKDLDELSKRTAKNYHITSYLFGEVKEVAKSLRQLDELSRNLKNDLLKFKEISYIEELENSIEKYIEKLKEREQLLVLLKEETNNEKREVDNYNSIQLKIEELQKSNEYKEFLNINNELESIDRELSNLKNSITDFFSPINRILRKFQKISIEHEKLIEDYLNQPAETLVNDKSLEIKNILKKLKEEIIKDKIKDKEEKINKALNIIDNFDEQNIKKLRSDYNELVNNKEKLENKLNLLKIKKDVDDLELEAQAVSNKLEKIRSNKEKLKLNIASINLEEIKEEIKLLAKNR